MGDEYDDNDYEDNFDDVDDPDEMEEIEEGAEEGAEQENIEILPRYQPIFGLLAFLSGGLYCKTFFRFLPRHVSQHWGFPERPVSFIGMLKVIKTESHRKGFHTVVI